MKGLVLFYSIYGHNYKMAEAVAKGLEKAGLEAVLRKVPETLPDLVIEKMGGLEARKAWAHVPNASLEDLTDAEAIIIGSPTRFGGMCAQMRTFIDSTGGLFAKTALLGKVGAMFTSSNSQHGGQESTILSSIPFFMHHGMIFTGLPYTYEGQNEVKQVNGCSPYGASTICGMDGSLQPKDIDINGAIYLGEYVGKITKKLRS